MLQNPTSPPRDKIPQPLPSPKGIFPTWSESNVAPSVSGNMHVSFNIRPSVSLTVFVNTLEKEAHSRGYNNVWCNRLVKVNSHADYKAVPTSQNAFYVTSGGFNGWSLAYCKGPDGEELEFNQVVANAKVDFDQAQATYVAGGENK